MNVRGTDTIDPLDADRSGIDPESVGECCEDDRLVARIPAVDVESRVGLGVAELHRLSECLGVVEARLLHAGEDVIARAVEDPVN